MIVLEAKGIQQSYEGNKVIENISITLGAGEIVCLIGTSGVGKTTLFHVLSGLTNPEKGQVLLNGKNITGIAGKISYMLQKDLLLPYRTIEDNISLPLRIQGMKRKLARQQVAPYFETFGLDFALPAMLIGLLALLIKTKRDLIVCVLAGVLTLFLNTTSLENFSVIISSVLVSLVLVGGNHDKLHE